jgi:hypothetical protein
VTSPPRQLLVVLGAGRSGTSLTAGVFSELGFWVPQPEVEANETNPRGFGEPRWVVNFHAKLMARYGVDLFDARPSAWTAAEQVMDEPVELGYLRNWLTWEFDDHDRVVVKDPRAGWFLPMWTDRVALLELNAAFVMPLRHPSEVLSSVRTTAGRRHTEATRAAWWVNMMLHLEQLTRGSRRAFISYDGLLSEWRREIAQVEESVGLPVLSQADEAARARVDQLVDPSLRRSARGWAAVEVPRVVEDLADRVWDQLSAMTAAGADDDEGRKTLDALREEYVALYNDAEAIADSSVLAAEKSLERRRRAADEAVPRTLLRRARRAAALAWREVRTR